MSVIDLLSLATVELAVPSWWTRPVADWLARQICQYGHLAEYDPDRFPWLLTGRGLGRCPDNEPLLAADPEPLAWVSEQVLAEARER